LDYLHNLKWQFLKKKVYLRKLFNFNSKKSEMRLIPIISLIVGILLLFLFITIIDGLGASEGVFFEDWETKDFNDWDNTNWQIDDSSVFRDAASAQCPPQTDCTLDSAVSLDTSGHSSVNVSFWFNDDDMDPADEATWYWNDSNGNWDLIGSTIDAGTLGLNDDTWYIHSFESSNAQYLHAGFAVRFYASGGPNENYWIDDINVTGTLETTPPDLNIAYPTNNSNLSSNMTDVNYTFGDAADCWYSNDSYAVNITLPTCANITIVNWTEGYHNVTIWANDSANNINSSWVAFTIDITNPWINLTNPSNNTKNDTTNTIDFYFNTTDTGGTGVKNCTLIINDQENETNLGITEGSINSITTYLTNADYNWSVNCTDYANNVNASQTFNISIDVSPDLFPNVTLNKPDDGDTLTSPKDIIFNCTSYDDSDLKNVTLYYNGTGGGEGEGIIYVQNVSNFTDYTPEPNNILTLVLPNAPTSGNLLVTGVSIDKDSGAITKPTDFIVIHTNSSTTPNEGVSGALAYKISDGSEQTTSWTWATDQDATGFIIEYSGVDTSNPLDVSSFNDSYLNTMVGSINTTSITTTGSNELIIAFIATDSGNTALDPWGYTDSFSHLINDTQTSGSPLIIVGNRTLANAGTISTNVSWTGDDEAYAIIAAFNPAGSIDWHANETIDITGVSNETITDNETYSWACYVCDTSNQCNWSDTNFTLDINSSFGVDNPPSVRLDLPLNDTTKNYTEINFTFTAKDDVNLVNSTLYFCNVTTSAESEEPVDVEWIANRSTWYYNDTNSTLAADWMNISDYLDWSSGQAYLATSLETGGVGYNTMVQNGSDGAFPNYYFMKNFTITDLTKLNNMSFQIDYDDSYAVWINGYFINTSNTTTDWTDFDQASSPTHNSLIELAGGSDPKFPRYNLTETQLGYLITGVNNISVQLKQTTPYGGSSDTAFELRLFGKENQTVGGSLTCDSNGFKANTTLDINGTTNSTNITISMIDNRTYWWNIYVCDNATSTQCAFNETNFTLYVNTSYEEPETPEDLPEWCAFHFVHTEYSDGTDTPTEALAKMKEFYDCGGSNDHDTQLDQTEWTYYINEAEGNYTTNFTYFFGTEWTSATQHIYYISMNHSVIQQDAGDSSFNNLETELTPWLKQNGSLGMYNHPARTSGDTKFNNASQVNETYIPLVSIINNQGGTFYWHLNYAWNCTASSGCDSYNNPKASGLQDATGNGWAIVGLNQGYHLGFGCGNDKHETLTDWVPQCFIGLSNVSNSTRGGVYDAIKKRHTWVSENQTQVNIVVYNGSDYLGMGDIFNYSSSTNNLTINFTINATSGAEISNVSLFYNGWIVNVSNFSGSQNITGSITYNLTEDVEEYLFLEVVQDNNQRAWTSPIFVTYSASEQVVVKNIIQGINTSENINKLGEFWENLKKVLSITGLGERISNIFKDLMQSFDINLIMNRLKEVLRIPLQLFSVNLIMNKLGDMFRNPMQRIIVNVKATITSLMQYLEEISQALNINSTMIKTSDFFKSLFQDFNIGEIISKFKSSIVNITESLSPNIILERLANFFRVFSQIIQVNSILTKISDFFRNIFQIILVMLGIIAETGSPEIGLEMIYPLTNIDVSQNQFFNVTVNISCLNANCGEVNISLDPPGESSKKIAINQFSSNPEIQYFNVSLDNGLKIYYRGYAITYLPIFVMDDGTQYTWSQIPSTIQKDLWKEQIAGNKYKWGIDFLNVSTNIKENVGGGLKYVVLHRTNATKIVDETEVAMNLDDIQGRIQIQGNTIILNNKVSISHDDILSTYNLPIINRSDIVIGGLDNSWLICHEYDETGCINESIGKNWIDNGDGTWNISFDPSVTISEEEVITDSLLTDVIAETGNSNFTHLNISTSSPYDSLVFYMPFDGDKNDTKLTSHYDFTKYNNDGTGVDNAYVNSTNCLSGFDNCLHVDGVDDGVSGDHVIVSDPPSLRNHINFTVMYWEKPGSYNQNSDQDTVISKVYYQWYIGHQTDGDIMVNIGTATCNGNLIYTDYAGSVPTIGEWSHIVMRVNDTGGTMVEVWKNGVSQGVKSDASGMCPSDTEDLSIGARTPSTEHFNGSIDEVMIFNTSLTVAQIQEIYNNQSARFVGTGKQELSNQTYLNISSGNNKVNVTTIFDNNFDSNLSLFLQYYESGAWSSTSAKNLTSGTNSTFTIGSTSTNLTLNYTLIAGNDSVTPFYTPIVYDDIILD